MTPDTMTLDPIKKHSQALDCNITLSLIESDPERSVFSVVLFHTDGKTHLDDLTFELDTSDAVYAVSSGEIFSMIEDMYLQIQQERKDAMYAQGTGTQVNTDVRLN